MARLIAVEDMIGPSVVGRGGHAMRVLQLLEGLRRLGHDVLFLEFLEEAPPAEAVAWLDDALAGRWDPARVAILDAATGESFAGASGREVAAFADGAEAVLSLAATYRAEPWPLIGDIRPRVLIEQDPAYTHLWAAPEPDPTVIFGAHDVHFTVGLNVGTPRSAIPTCGLEWHPVQHPIISDWWAPPAALARDRFTTIAAWRDYGYLEFEDRILGPKVDEFQHFLDLPERAGEPLELTLAIDDEDPDRKLLLGHGWLLEPPALVGTTERYRDYVAGSLGEFSCAKGGYVGTHSGWFSDRSACYLAAGRPVVLQATGFEDVLPTGAGLFAVADADEAAAAMQEIRGDYRRHSQAARELARELFDAEKVLGEILEHAGVA
jgi:hypothetical protein